MHIVLICIFCMIKLNMDIFIYNESELGISNEF
ncbi:serine kinase [Bacillus thuringiensis]|nr:serine kinase [Bacillus toyonensis biovar Thuringiensis]